MVPHLDVNDLVELNVVHLDGGEHRAVCVSILPHIDDGHLELAGNGDELAVAVPGNIFEVVQLVDLHLLPSCAVLDAVH